MADARDFSKGECLRVHKLLKTSKRAKHVSRGIYKTLGLRNNRTMHWREIRDALYMTGYMTPQAKS
jgi:hypothetical protein